MTAWKLAGKTVNEVGIHSDEGPPVPIPNTEVKLINAENTLRVTAREDRTTPTQRRQGVLRKATSPCL